MEEMLEKTAGFIPENSLRFALGVGTPEDIIRCYSYGWDMFDCVIPTRLARHGAFFDARGKRLNIRNSSYRLDKKPLVKDCPCEACQNFSRAYLRHLYVTNEMLVYRLLTLHNLTFIFGFMQRIRESIREGTFGRMKAKYEQDV
jgi:queuine tRNA-ribosyltransferase